MSEPIIASESTMSKPDAATEPTITVTEKESSNFGVNLIGFVCTAMVIVGPVLLVITGWK